MIDIVIPFCSADAEKALKLFRVIETLKNIDGRTFILAHTASTKATANIGESMLKALGASVHTVQCEEIIAPWPIGANNYFAEVLKRLYVYRTEKQLPVRSFLWMEPDCVPWREFWLQGVEREFMRTSKLVIGRPIKTGYMFEGRFIPNENDSPMLLGCSIYPAHFHLFVVVAPLFQALQNRVPREGGSFEPFDMLFRYAIQQLGHEASRFVDDQWKTRKYRFEGERLVCDSEPHEGRKRGGIVDVESWLVHGCKDDSVYEAVLGKYAPAQQTEPEEEPEPAPAAAPKPQTAPKQVKKAAGKRSKVKKKPGRKKKVDNSKPKVLSAEDEQKVRDGTTNILILCRKYQITRPQLQNELRRIGYDIESKQIVPM